MVTAFVEKRHKYINTIKTYKRHLNNYFDWLKQPPELYLQQNNNFKKDIENYYESMYKLNVPPKSRKCALASIKVFMLYNLPNYDNRLPPSFWFKLSHGLYRGSNAEVNDKVPTVDTLRKILIGANLRSKTLFMMLATSGMRIGEALSLNWSDIDFKNNPVSIKLSAEITKTKTGRYVFITPETRDILLEWRDAHQNYINNRKQTDAKNYDPKKVFPFTYQNSSRMWYTLLKNSRNMEKDHKRYVYHIHGLRKFFRSRCAKLLAPDYIEFLMGHKTARTKEYLDLPIEELGEEYIKGSDRLLIFQVEADTSDMRAEIQKLKNSYITLEKEMQMVLRLSDRLGK